MIRFLDLPSEYHELKPEIDAVVARVLESGQFVGGPEVAALEEEFARYCGARHGVAVNSGTSALHLALLAAGIPIVEHLTGLGQLPPTGARFTALPLRIEATGTIPVRAFARLPE